jgi:sugar (pentulose or hexulose) kinase
LPSTSPRLWARTRTYLLLSGYLNYRFTGRLVDSVASQVGYVPFDYKKGRWAPPHDWKWQALPITPAMLPELVAPGTVIGKVSAQAAQDTGIPAGLPVLAGAADKACEVLGAGCLTPDIACLSYGTAATINTTTPRYLEATPFIPPYQAAVPGHYNTEVQITRGFWMVNWFKEQFGLHEQQQAMREGVTPESLFDALVNQSATRRPGPHAAALLEPRHQGARPRGQGRGDWFWRRAHPRPPVPRHPRRPGLRAARSQGAHRKARRRAHHDWCASRAAARKATPPCRSPPTSSTCPASARICTKPAAWAPP